MNANTKYYRYDDKEDPCVLNPYLPSVSLMFFLSFMAPIMSATKEIIIPMVNMYSRMPCWQHQTPLLFVTKIPFMNIYFVFVAFIVAIAS